jgi:hypothetical protein
MAKGRPRKTDGAGDPPDKGNGANLGFEAQMFLAADKLRDPSSTRRFRQYSSCFIPVGGGVVVARDFSPRALASADGRVLKPLRVLEQELRAEGRRVQDFACGFLFVLRRT